MRTLAANSHARRLLKVALTSALLLVVVILADVHRTSAQNVPANPIASLQRELDAGMTRLDFDPERGYLESLLQVLKIPQSSQVLVFSKTSLQRESISPSQPRAIYFNDNVYVAYLQNGLPLEVAVADPGGRIVFYSLDQTDSAAPRFKGDTTCNLCHDPAHTGTPLLIMRSHFTDVRGYALQAEGQMSQLQFRITDQTPFGQRWGGWYVTGTHGQQLHMGNMTAPLEVERIGSNPAAYTARMDRKPGANVVSLDRFLDTERYLTGSSDIVALMVLAHQVQLHNLISTAISEARATSAVTPPLREAVERLLRALFMIGEIPLADPVQGTTPFASEFAAGGPRDRRGRSFRDLDLRQRLLRHRFSYMIYDDALTQAPANLKSVLYRRLRDVLDGSDSSPAFKELSTENKTAIREILRDTKPEVFRLESGKEETERRE